MPKAALSIDVEDWFCVRNLSGVIARTDWESCEQRLSQGLEFLLEELDRKRTRATFFVLGWIAERNPEVVRAIAAAGHEIGTHGYSHRGLEEMTAAELDDEIKRSTGLLAALTGQEIRGFRAPHFSITERTLWALDVLRENGIRYDSSIFPVRHPNYGIPSFSPEIREIQGIVEVPLTAARFGTLAVPAAGGGFFRLYPYAVTRSLIRRTLSHRDVVMYFHPWEFDPEQPRMRRLPVGRRFRHYVGLAANREKFSRLLDDFEFVPIGNLVDEFVKRRSRPQEGPWDAPCRDITSANGSPARRP